MKGMSEWILLIGGIIVAVLVIAIVFIQIQNSMKLVVEKRSVESYAEIANIANNLCWSFEGNTREYSFELGETIKGIYASGTPPAEYEDVQLLNNIISKEQSSGESLCIKVEGKRVTCYQLGCNTTIPFIGSVPEQFSLSMLVNILLGKGRVTSYSLHFVREVNSVEIFLAGI